MGLIKAALGAAGGTLADQWKEFFYCDAIDNDVLAVKGQKRTSKRSSNTKGSDNIITTGSGIAVADGQCMMIVEQGKIVDICAEPGEYTYDASTEPSIFSGNLGDAIMNTFHTIGKRFTFGGDTGKDQRVYYFNTKELVDNKFGTPNPIPFRVVDQNIGLDIDVSVRCSGVYSYRIAEEDACRMEHVVSDETVQQICNFVNYGSTFEHALRNTDLRYRYEPREYSFLMGIYYMEKTCPRRLAGEFKNYKEQIRLHVKKEDSYFELFCTAPEEKKCSLVCGPRKRLGKSRRRKRKSPDPNRRF